ncbi:MAG: Ig-like domain-containing protein [Terriglobales bacterium]
MLTGRKLALTLAFTVLVAVAFGVSCRGFFVKPTLASITIQPATPSVELGQTATLQAYGLDNETPAQGAYLTSGVSWSSSDNTIATVSGTGNAVITGVALGTATITASSESVTNTATATVYITVTTMTMAPSSQTISTVGGVTPEPYIVTANGSIDISSGATLTVNQNGTQITTITCAYDASGAGGAGQYCTGSGSESTGTYQVVAAYTNTNLVAKAGLTIQ